MAEPDETSTTLASPAPVAPAADPSEAPPPPTPKDALDAPAPRVFASDALRGVKLPPMPLNLPPAERSGPVPSVPLPLAAHLGELIDRDPDTEATPPTAIPGVGHDGLVAGWGDDDEDEEDAPPPGPVLPVDAAPPEETPAALRGPASSEVAGPEATAPPAPTVSAAPAAPAAGPSLVLVVGVALGAGVGIGAALMWALK